MKRLKILILVLAVTLIAGNVIEAKVNRSRKNNRTNLPANLNELMKAPSVQTDEYGFYNINLDAPRSYPKVRVKIMEGGGEAKIFVDLKLFQTHCCPIKNVDD